MASLTIDPIHATFIHSPKTGGNSVTTWLLEHFDFCRISKRKQHATVIQARERLGPLGWTYGIVRNPWALSYSWYTFKIKLANLYIENCRAEPERIKPGSYRWDLKANLERKKFLDQGFIPWFHQAHISRQEKWLTGVHYVMKLENLVSEFEVVQNKLNCHQPLPHLNKSTNSKQAYIDHYDSETKDLVYQRHAETIKKYNYEFET